MGESINFFLQRLRAAVPHTGGFSLHVLPHLQLWGSGDQGHQGTQGPQVQELSSATAPSAAQPQPWDGALLSCNQERCATGEREDWERAGG